MLSHSCPVASDIGLDSLTTTAISGAVNVAATILSLFIVDRFGRARILMCGATGMLICSAIVTGVTYHAGTDSSLITSGEGKVVVVFICLFIVNFAYSWGPYGWVIPAEIFPLSVRGKAVGLTTSLNWLANFAIAELVPPLISGPGIGACFLLFTCLLAMIWVWTALFVVETRGAALERMDILFDVHNWAQLKAYCANNVYALVHSEEQVQARLDKTAGKAKAKALLAQAEAEAALAAVNQAHSNGYSKQIGGSPLTGPAVSATPGGLPAPSASPLDDEQPAAAPTHVNDVYLQQ